MLRRHLDERQRRLLLGVEASELGRGGIKTVSQATGVHPDTVARGVHELECNPEPQARVHPYLSDLQTVRQSRAAHHLPDRIRQPGDVPQRLRDGADPGLVQP